MSLLKAKENSLFALHKIRENTGFQRPAFSRILAYFMNFCFLYARVLLSEHPHSPPATLKIMPKHPYPPIKNVHSLPPTQIIPPTIFAHPHPTLKNVHPLPLSQNIPPPTPSLTPNHPEIKWISDDEKRWQNDKRSIPEMKTALKVVKLYYFKGVFFWFLSGVRKNGEVSFFQKNKGTKIPWLITQSTFSFRWAVKVNLFQKCLTLVKTKAEETELGKGKGIA